MTQATEKRIKEDIQIFKRVTLDQRRQQSQDAKAFIVALIREYNETVRFPDEPTLAIKEVWG